jgi:hypothetical protein
MGCFWEKVKNLLPNFFCITIFKNIHASEVRRIRQIRYFAISLVLRSYLGRTCVVFGSNETKPTVAFRLRHFFRKINQTKLLIYNTFSLFN